MTFLPTKFIFKQYIYIYIYLLTLEILHIISSQETKIIVFLLQSI